MKKKALLLAIVILSIAGGVYYHSLKSDNLDVLTLYGNVDVRQVDISFQVPGVIDSMFF